MLRCDFMGPLLARGGSTEDLDSMPGGRLPFGAPRLPLGTPRIALGLMVLIASSGCGKPAESAEASTQADAPIQAEVPADGVLKLSHAYASPNALGRAVLDAIEGDDATGLAALRVTRDEYETFFWDELSVMNGGAPLDFVWQMNNDNSRGGLKAVLEEFGGQEFEFIEVRFTEPPETYSDFSLYFGTQLWVKRSSDGKEGVLPTLSVLVERHGLWKLLNIPE